MSKCTFDRLVRLSRDRDYQRALDQLFRICVLEVDPLPATRRKVTLFIVAALGLAALGSCAAFLVLTP